MITETEVFAPVPDTAHILKIPCYRGPFDGETLVVYPSDLGVTGRADVASKDRTHHATYQLAMHWTKRRGNCGLCLVHVP